MKKTLFLLIITFHSLFAATSQEILNYLSLSHSEQEVLSIEQVFDSMRQSQENNESNASTSDVTIVYQEYLEEHLSSNEISEALVLYRTPIMERYVSEVKNFNINQDDMDAFLAFLKEVPLPSEREDIVNEIVNIIINKALQINFYRSMMQRYPQNSESNNSSKDEDNESSMTPREESYVNSMKKSEKEHLLYGSQVFSIEEMTELRTAMKSSIFKKIKRVENEALVQIMNNFIQGIVSEPKQKEEKSKGGESKKTTLPMPSSE